jgi:hypothetical protein
MPQIWFNVFSDLMGGENRIFPAKKAEGYVCLVGVGPGIRRLGWLLRRPGIPAVSLLTFFAAKESKSR